MSKLYLKGKLRYRLKSYLAISKISLGVMGRRLIGKPLVKPWPVLFEIGVLFWRHQFNQAFAMDDIREGRAFFDSLITTTGERFALAEAASLRGAPPGKWFRLEQKDDATDSETHLLYLHGGGYSFRSDISTHYARAIAGILELPLFMAHYRLTPEHPYPAQTEDALAAYEYMLSENIAPDKIVIIGDSAGGHLVLMLLQALRDKAFPQPALAIAMSPWTDIGERGASLHGNDKYDLVQGYMAVRFGRWLKGNTSYSREDMSPIYQDYSGLAPLYIQGAGREVLIDMIIDFTDMVKRQGGEIVLDIWPDMIHNFQAHGRTHPDSLAAYKRLKSQIEAKTNRAAPLSSGPKTRIANTPAAPLQSQGHT